MTADRRTIVFMLACLGSVALAETKRQMESLDRGTVAVAQGDGKVFVGWRLLGTEPADLAFNVYRTVGDGLAMKLNNQPLRGPTNFVDEHPEAATRSTYSVRSTATA